MNKRAIPSIGPPCETENAYWPDRFDRQPIETADLISLAVEQLDHPDRIPLTRIGATSVGKLFDALSTPLMLVDRSLRIAFANRACRKVSAGYEKNIGCPVNSILSQESTARGFRFLLERVSINRTPLIVEAPVRLGGTDIAGRLHLRALRFGRKRSILIVIEDLTHENRALSSGSRHAESVHNAHAAFRALNDMLALEIGSRENLEQALQRKDWAFRQLREEAPQTKHARHSPLHSGRDAIVLCDMRGRYLYMNGSFTRVLGWSVPEPRGQEMAYAKESHDEIPVSRMIEWIANGGQWDRLPAKRYAKEGIPVPVDLKASPSADLTGRPDGLPMFVRDLIRHKTAEEVVRRSEETATALINASGDAVGLLDTEGLVLASNAIFAGRVGLTVGQFVGRNLLEFFPEPLAQKRMERGMEAIATGRPVRFSDERAGRCLDNTVCPLFDRDGRVERLAVVSRDITDQVRALAELQRARDVADVATRAKREFLSNVSHELRTPLNSIIGFSEILEDQLFGELNEKQLAHVSHVLSSGRQLLQLIDNILDLANLESGEMELRIAGVNIRQVLESSMVMLSERALKQGLTTNLRVADELADMRIEADQAKLKQIVFTLVSNAIKFTPVGGEILVEADKKVDDLIIRVSDTGIGLRPEDQDRVFQAFEQVDSSHTRKHAGTGLGLALTKKMVELHGGRICVESPGLGRGSTFTFSIPVYSPLPNVSELK